MSAAEKLGLYAQGWSTGDANLILQAVTQDYTFNDPNVGEISKAGFADYFEELKNQVKTMRGGDLPAPFMEISEIVTMENDEGLTAWGWWEIPGTPIKGAGLMKVESSGVRSEVITYYAKVNP